MKYRALVPSLLIVLFVATFFPAQTAPLRANTRLSEILRLPALQPGDWQALFSMAESGDPQAQYWLGRIYESGRLLPLDNEKAAYWYQKSAEQGYAPAGYWVCGKRADRDLLEHERSMWRAAEKSVPEAQFWLGMAFEQHLWFGMAFEQHLWFGVTDKREALKWFRKAAEQGNPDAEYVVGAGFAERLNTSPIWAEQGREETTWGFYMHMATESRRTAFRLTCGFLSPATTETSTGSSTK
jgi:TPR repeat protein